MCSCWKITRNMAGHPFCLVSVCATDKDLEYLSKTTLMWDLIPPTRLDQSANYLARHQEPNPYTQILSHLSPNTSKNPFIHQHPTFCVKRSLALPHPYAYLSISYQGNCDLAVIWTEDLFTGCTSMYISSSASRKWWESNIFSRASSHNGNGSFAGEFRCFHRDCS